MKPPVKIGPPNAPKRGRSSVPPRDRMPLHPAMRPKSRRHSRFLPNSRPSGLTLFCRRATHGKSCCPCNLEHTYAYRPAEKQRSRSRMVRRGLLLWNCFMTANRKTLTGGTGSSDDTASPPPPLWWRCVRRRNRRRPPPCPDPGPARHSPAGPPESGPGRHRSR